MKITNRLLQLGVLSALSATAAAGESAAGAGPVAVDTSKWECKLCKFEEGTSGALEVGLGSVSDRAARFGDYTGLDKDGTFLIGEGEARNRGADGTYWNVDAANLGLRSRTLEAEGGRQGSYRLFLNYRELPHFVTDSARTPFAGAGGASLTLPAGFAALTTGTMPLAANLQQVDIRTDRKRLGVGISWLPTSAWEYALDFRRETRDGTKRSAGSFFVNAAQLVEPVDYVTDQVNASAAYGGKRLQTKFAYYGSRFHNSHDALTWANPYLMPAFPGAVTGQLALPPDNQFHQFSAFVGYQFTAHTRATADIAFGRMTQDESFLASTLNAGLGPGALPQTSLNGSVKTRNANVRLTSAVTDQLRLTASYTHDDRDNRTPQAVVPWVTTDMFVSAARTTLPYSFTHDRFKLTGEYAYSRRLRASAGIDHDRHERTYQEVSRTREDGVWAKVSARALENLDLSLRLAHGERRGSAYQPVAAIVPPENPLLRKYNMAGRTRDNAALRADFAVTDGINVGVGIDTSEDKYKGSTIGLTEGKDFGLNGDLSAVLTEQTSLRLFANHQKIRSGQAGSQAFATPDWTAENRDTVNVLGIGLRHAAIKDKLDLGADYVHTRARSAIRVFTGAADPAFPDLTSSLDTVKLYVIYRVKDDVTLRGGYWYERYRSENWMLDGVAPATIPNVLAFGEQSPRYRVHVLQLSVRFGF